VKDNTLIKKLFRKHILKIGKEGFVLAFYYKMFNDQKIFDFTREKILEDVGISKRSLTKYNEIMMQEGIIKHERKKIGGKQFLRIEFTDKIAESSKTRVLYYNTNYTLKNTKKTNKNIIDIKKYPKSYKYFKKVKSIFLSHGRYAHEVYISRFEKQEGSGISKKEFGNVKRLRKKIKYDDLKKYCEWWIKTKSKKFSGFSFGIVAYQEIIDEFLRTVKKVDPYKKMVRKSKDQSVRKKRIRNMKKRIEKINLRDIKDFEWDILKAAEQFELVEIKGKKVKILFGRK
jgi:hypothetical protein